MMPRHPAEKVPAAIPYIAFLDFVHIQRDAPHLTRRLGASSAQRRLPWLPLMAGAALLFLL